MTPLKRFLHGGGGALMPVLLSLIALDVGVIFTDGSVLNGANIAGIALRYTVLFLIGGVVAYLHTDENKPFKLFELGIVAPALLTSLVAAQGVQHSQFTDQALGLLDGISIIGQAHAADKPPSEKIVVAGGLLDDILRGVSGSIYRDPTGAAAAEAKARAAQAAARAQEVADLERARIAASQVQSRAAADVKIRALEAEIVRLQTLFPQDLIKRSH